MSRHAVRTNECSNAQTVAMVEAPTAHEAVRHFVAGLAAIEMRVAPLKRVISAATHDPDVMAILAGSEQLRRAGFREAVEHFAKHGLREGLDIERATDILLTVGDSSVYCSLVHDYGWQHEAFVEWLVDSVCGMLLPPSEVASAAQSRSNAAWMASESECS